MFVRGNVPMTKSEVRVLTLAKARIKEDSVVWDIGAGTGSVTVEAALLAHQGKVYAVEKEEDALALISSNLDKFGICNARIRPGSAPEVLTGLPTPDRVVIGGSAGKLKEIMECVYTRLGDGGRLVINVVALETLVQAVELVNSMEFNDVEITQVNISKTVGAGKVNMFKANSPVFIISAEKGKGVPQ